MGNQGGKEKDDKGDHLSREQLEDIHRLALNEISDMFKWFKKEAPTSVITKAEFKGVLQRMGVEDPFLQDLIFKVFDGTKTGCIRFPEFVLALSIITRGTPDEKLEFAFQMYDLDDKGHITREDMNKIMTSFLNLVGGDVVTFSGKKFESVEQLADAFFEQMDSMGDGKITIEEYKEGAIRNPDIVIGLGLSELRN
ncbi:Calciumbinding protein NCSA, putative [Acanthamoeba castellanii str. Neff]|uniref:Calciumbinding protein NCSA, putative n=1 Tax=Acanthamoeba castellanii (strain ATCC 30010 / Neff) TaxID=1257118 RepID=L8GQB2_ACACF|nr:Calciumbinding protein NCSA, putative [Acanthamoeba castellanii str. Neff]ELR15374.1 Calciumbinding protein NCSA, putative [Acanthamoeba castellanii str. Neff]